MPYNITTKLLVTSKAKRPFHGLADADPIRMQLNTIHEGSPVRKIMVLYETVAGVHVQLNKMNIPSTMERKLRI